MSNYSRTKTECLKTLKRREEWNSPIIQRLSVYYKLQTQKNRKILRNYISISCHRLQNIIYIIHFCNYLHPNSKLPLPEGLPGKPEPPNHPNFLLLTSFLPYHPNFHVQLISQNIQKFKNERHTHISSNNFTIFWSGFFLVL